ncbi:MAG: hypothetical protein ABSH35_24655 [Isosphaeraceae bacterium]|jgi:hypothetical protein
MWPDQLPDSLTRLVTPRAVRVYAEGLGWQRVEGVNGKIAVYKNPDSPLRQLIVPLDEQFDDYGVRTAEAIQRLAEFEKRPAKEILNHLLLPPADLLFLREVSSDAEVGNLPLDHAAQVIDGTRKVLLSAAHSVLVPQPYHPRMSRGEAEEFLSRCRLGQTGRGSFVLMVACPLGLKADLLGPNGEPFTRRVTSLLMQSLRELSQAADRMQIDDLADTSRHPGISANLCESLLLLRPTGERSYLNITVCWSRALLPESRESKREVQLRQEVFDVAEVLAPKLRSVPERRTDRFIGFVDELRGQPLPDIGLPSGEVRFTLFDQGEEIRAKADLDEMYYSFAGHAHLASRVVSFKGVLERLPRLNRIRGVTDFKIIEVDDGIPSQAEEAEQP